VLASSSDCAIASASWSWSFYPNHVWISYSGYNFKTPSQPGHVFEVTLSSGQPTWTDLSYNLADLPITALVRDDVTGDL
jgi:hypothetical protein